MNALQVRNAFKDMTGPQISRRNKRFEQGWRVTVASQLHGSYYIQYKDEMVARVTKLSTGALSIVML